jgi:hypothetical protein
MYRIPLAFCAFCLWLAPRALASPSEEGRPHPRGQPYVGAERCRACHATAHAKWASSPHARAHLSVPEARRNDSKCMICHSPDPGGVFLGVQCESCHGSGRAYSHNFVMKDRGLAKVLGLADPGERRCRSCHTKHGLRGPWDYEKKKRDIIHWTR